MAAREHNPIGRKTGHSPEIRRVLRAARERDGLSARELSERIGAILREQDPNARDPHMNTIYNWERSERDPGVDALELWALALGYRLVVALVDAETKRDPILLSTDEGAKVGRIVDQMPPRQRAAMMALAMSMQEES